MEVITEAELNNPHFSRPFFVDLLSQCLVNKRSISNFTLSSDIHASCFFDFTLHLSLLC